MDAKLVVVGGNATKGEVKLKLPMTVGRNKEAGLTISHPMVSRLHCQIYEVDGALVIRDNNSANGSYLNNERIDQETAIKPGDRLTIGPLTFVVIYQLNGPLPDVGKRRPPERIEGETVDVATGGGEEPPVWEELGDEDIFSEDHEEKTVHLSGNALFGAEANADDLWGNDLTDLVTGGDDDDAGERSPDDILDGLLDEVPDLEDLAPIGFDDDEEPNALAHSEGSADEFGSGVLDGDGPPTTAGGGDVNAFFASLMDDDDDEDESESDGIEVRDQNDEES